MIYFILLLFYLFYFVTCKVKILTELLHNLSSFLYSLQTYFPTVRKSSVLARYPKTRTVLFLTSISPKGFSHTVRKFVNSPWTEWTRRKVWVKFTDSQRIEYLNIQPLSCSYLGNYQNRLWIVIRIWYKGLREYTLGCFFRRKSVTQPWNLMN